jgi:DNA-directed RNA polymerase subunit L
MKEKLLETARKIKEPCEATVNEFREKWEQLSIQYKS